MKLSNSIVKCMLSNSVTTGKPNVSGDRHNTVALIDLQAGAVLQTPFSLIT